MDTTVFFFLIIIFYGALLFFDLFFKSCAHYPYLRLLDGLGLEIGYFNLKWSTKALNRLFLKWGNIRPQFWRAWFSVGIYASLIFLPISICLLFYSAFVSFFRHEIATSSPVITPVIPGVNLPVAELGYYSLTLVICSVVHEAGHALAAVLYDLGVIEVGLNLYFILPVACVRLPTEKLTALNLKSKLSIFCAGIWHNLLLSFFGYLLYCSLPTIFSPFYYTGKGVQISDISRHSPLKSPEGLHINDIILSINDCKVTNEDDWFNCLSNRELLLPGICVESELVNTLDESVPLKHIGNGIVECCDPSNKKNLCFEYTDLENNELELPGHVCLPGRTIIEKSANFCTIGPHVCTGNFYCFKPVLPNNTYLFKVTLKRARPVIYIGHPSDFYRTIDVSSYIKRTNLLGLNIPDISTKLLKYIVVISLGLAFVNVLPFMYMDGEYVTKVLGLILLKDIIGKRKSVLVATVITWLFTIFLILVLVHAAFRML